MTSSWEGQSIRLEVIGGKKNQHTLRADTSRHLCVYQCRLEEMLEISCASAIIRQFCSVGRYCDIIPRCVT